MTPSPWLYGFLKTYERFRPTAYKPTPKDVWTIGWGHTAGVKEGDTCTTEQAQTWLEQDVAWAATAVNKDVTHPLLQCQFDALVSLCFNIGAPHFSTAGLVRLLNVPSQLSAAEVHVLFDAWDKQAGEVLTGLLRRREAEAQHFLGLS